VLPFSVFGLHYNKDIVLQSNDPSVEMLEIVMLEVPPEMAQSGQIWFAKISDRGGEQRLFSNSPEIETWFPELNAPRHAQEMDFLVVHSQEQTAEQVDLSLYLPDGRRLRATARYSGQPKRPKKTNSSTFNHSQDIAMALLEVSAKDTKIEASMSLAGERLPLKKVLGLIPIKAFLEQTQGGIATSSVKVHASGNAEIHLSRPIAGDSWTIPGDQVCEIGEELVRCDNLLTKTIYFFQDGGLDYATVQSWTGDEVFRLKLDSPLPDLSRPFAGELTRRFVADVGTIKGAGVGQIHAMWKDGEVIIDIRPEAPRWFASRPMRSTIRFDQEGGYSLSTIRIAPE